MDVKEFCRGLELIADKQAGESQSEDSVNVNGFEVETMMSFPENSNPFRYDSYHMGVEIGNNVTAMFASNQDGSIDYVILVNKVSGRRIKVRI